MTDTSNRSTAAGPGEPADWRRMRFQKNKVWMALDAGGRPLRHKNKVLIKYQLNQSHQYWVRAENIQEIDAAPPGSQSPKASPKKQPDPQAPQSAGDPGAGCGKNTICIYTDGASSGNPGPSGIGVLLRYGSHEREISEYIGIATNNIAELTAVKAALEAIQRDDLPVRLYTDSSYVHGLLTKGWKAQKNRELVAELRSLCSKFRDIKFLKVAGHAGNEGNERADRLATSAIKKGSADSARQSPEPTA
ncbi:MAG TPA: ribonuclease H [Desulfosalsimonadaceae bacterium]|nr:ribonuclease H [Desulfosalsimonadaceae bacterium]